MKLFHILTCLIAFMIGWSVFDDQVFEYDKERISELLGSDEWRNPAALQKNLFSHKPKKISKKKFLSVLHFENKETYVKVDVNCQFDRKLKMQFIGDGVAENGNLPLLEVEAECPKSSSADTELRIPVGKIKEFPSYQLDHFFFEEENLFITVKNASYMLPSTWHLKSVQFVSEQNELDEIKFVGAGETPTMNWSE